MTRYYTVKINNLEPLRIGDASTSQRGQTDTLPYIPGSVLRGIALHGIRGEESFEEKKRLLLSDRVRFLNAYPAVRGKDGEWIPLLPSLRGFREEKDGLQEDGARRILSEIFSKKVPEGMKNAQIGAFCLPDGQCLRYLMPERRSDLNLDVRKEEDNLFRSQYLSKNQIFQGYIALEEEQAAEQLKRVLKGKIRIGNRRTSGYGTCAIELEETACPPYRSYAAAQDLEGSCYLLLLSDTLMRGQDGEMSGLDLPALEKQMGVEDLKIEKAAAGVREVGGFNRTWECRVPSVKMYEKGSLFLLSYTGTLKKSVMERLADEGIGIRRNEGCGRLLFLSGDTPLADIGYKREIQDNANVVVDPGLQREDVTPEEWKKSEDDTLAIMARGYYGGLLDRAVMGYVLRNPLPAKGMSKSQIGTVHAIASQYRNEPEKAKEKLNQYFENLKKRQADYKRQTEWRNAGELAGFIERLEKEDLSAILSEGLVEERLPEYVMGKRVDQIFSRDELERRKLLLLLDMIRYANKEGKEND